MTASRPLIRIALFRNDLRLHDQPLLHAACKPMSRKFELLPLYCVDPRQYDLSPLNAVDNLGPFEGAKTWHFAFPRAAEHKTRFLVETVQDLQKSLRERQSDLLVRFGEPEKIVRGIVEHLKHESDADVELFCQKEQTYEETQVEKALGKTCTLTLTDGGSTMIHPEDAPFEPSECPDIFTAFRKAVEGLREQMVRPELPIIDKLPPFPEAARKYLSAHNDDGLPARLAKSKSKYDERSTIPYSGGETTGLKRLEHYVSAHPSTQPSTVPGNSGGKPSRDAPLFTYKHTRNALFGADGSTHFSPWLALGALSARHIFWRIRAAEEKHPSGGNNDSYWLVFELLWRDYWKFAARGPLGEDRLFKLYGTLRNKVNAEPNDVGRRGKGGKRVEGHMGAKGQLRHAQAHPPASKEWSHDERKFKAWKDGMTGVPFVDANMRELAATGYMSNRGRQNVASFISKQLHIDWRMGAEWFESQLVDHDVCSNYGNWAYVAGVGTDPRERIFNVLKQAKDYDAKGDYVRLWLPELARVPDAHVHHPWTWKEVNGDVMNGYPTKPIIFRDEWRSQTQRVAGGKQGGKGGRGGGGPRAKGKKQAKSD